MTTKHAAEKTAEKTSTPSIEENQAAGAGQSENVGPEAIKREQEVADRLNKAIEQEANGSLAHNASYEELPKPQNDPEFGRYPTGAQVHQRVMDNAPEVAQQADAARHGGQVDGAEPAHQGAAKGEKADGGKSSGAKSHAR